MRKNKNSNDMEDKIFKILRENKIGHHKAHYIKNELLILFGVSNFVCPLCKSNKNTDYGSDLRECQNCGKTFKGK
jgi:transposase-like protein